MTPIELLKREIEKARREKLELAMLLQLKAYKLDTGMVRQYAFDKDRKWRADFAWPAFMVMLEVDGGIYTSGRHTRGNGYENDCIKRAHAVMLGWRVFNVTAKLIKNGIAIKWVKTLVKT